MNRSLISFILIIAAIILPLAGATSLYPSHTLKQLLNFSITSDITFFSVPHATGMKADFSDVRFSDATGITELSYFIENYTSNGTAFVRVQTNKSTGIWMYYGDASAITTSNFSRVFYAPTDYWFLDEVTGTALSYARNNGGTITGGVSQHVAGRLGYSYYFDGSTGYVTMANAPMFTNGCMTLNVWVNRNTTQNTYAPWIISRGASAAWFGIVANLTEFMKGVGSIATWNAMPTANTWVMMTAIANGSSGELFILADGVYVVNTTTSAGLDWTATLSLGRDSAAGGRFYRGFMADVGIWHTCLSLTEVAALHNTAAPNVTFGNAMSNDVNANIYGIIYAQSYGANVPHAAASITSLYPNGTVIATAHSDAYGQFFINATVGNTTLYMSSTSGRTFLTTDYVATAPGNNLYYPVMYPTYPIVYGYAKYANGSNFSGAIVAIYNASANTIFDAMVTGASGYYGVFSDRGNMSLRAATPSGAREYWYDAYLDVQSDTYREIVLAPVVPYYSVSGLAYYENGTEAWASFYLVNNTGRSLVGYANATPGVNSYYFPVQTGNYTLIASVSAGLWGVYSGSQVLAVTDNTISNIWVYASRPILQLQPSNNTVIPADGLRFFGVLGDFTHADVTDYDAFGFVLDNGTNIIYNITRANNPSPYFEASLVHFYALNFQNTFLSGFPTVNWSVIAPYIANASFTNYSTQGVYVNMTGKPTGTWHSHAWWHQISTNTTDWEENSYRVMAGSVVIASPVPAPADNEFSSPIDAWIIAFILSMGVGIALSRYSTEGGAIGFVLAMFIFTGMGWLPVYVPIVAGLFMAGIYAVIGDGKGKK